jgi:hypothetical protein
MTNSSTSVADASAEAGVAALTKEKEALWAGFFAWLVVLVLMGWRLAWFAARVMYRPSGIRWSSIHDRTTSDE